MEERRELKNGVREDDKLVSEGKELLLEFKDEQDKFGAQQQASAQPHSSSSPLPWRSEAVHAEAQDSLPNPLPSALSITTFPPLSQVTPRLPPQAPAP